MDILERLRSVQNTCVQYVQCSDIMRDAADEIAKLRTELKSVAKDAERYRWMVGDEGGDVMYEVLTGVYATKEDIDAAIERSQGEQSGNN